MDLEKGWRVEQVGEYYQIGEKKEENNWHHKEANHGKLKNREF